MHQQMKSPDQVEGKQEGIVQQKKANDIGQQGNVNHSSPISRQAPGFTGTGSGISQTQQTKQGGMSPYQSPQSNLSPIQTKQSGLTPYVTKEGSKGPIQAKQRPVQRSQQASQSSGNLNEDQIKTNVSSLMGTDVSDARVHYNSSKPAQLKAVAYAQDNDVYMSSGKGQNNDILGHELAHNAQNKQGRVAATVQRKGVDINDSPVLEKEADVIGAQAASMQTPAQMKAVSSTPTQKNGIVQGIFEDGDQKYNHFLNGNNGLLDDILGDHAADFEDILNDGDEQIMINIDEWLLPKGLAEKKQEILDKLDFQEPKQEKAKPKKSKLKPKGKHKARISGKDMLSSLMNVPDVELDPAQKLVSSMKGLMHQEVLQHTGPADKRGGFGSWMKGDKKTPLPTKSNCWNAVLIAAHEAKLIDKKFIKEANTPVELQGKGGSIQSVKFVQHIINNARGNVQVNSKIANSKVRNADLIDRLSGAQIPVGDVVVIGRAGMHVLVSVGGGKVIELDNRGLSIQKDNPKFKEDYKERHAADTKQIKDVRSMLSEAKAKKQELKDNPEELAQVEKEIKKIEADIKRLERRFRKWKANSSSKNLLTGWHRMDNEILITTLIESHFLEGGDLDGVWWGAMPQSFDS